MTAVPQLVRVRCPYCSHGKHPKEFVLIGTGGARMCWDCYAWHLESIHALAEGEPPKGCFDCRKTWAELRAIYRVGDNPDEVKMFLVPKDGIQQLLCGTCSDAYERKRADLLRDTAYGKQKGI